MAMDSRGNTWGLRRRREVRDAFILLITDNDIKDITLDALDMAIDKKIDPLTRLKAKEFIFKYMIPLPKQEIDITSNNETITGYKFEIVTAPKIEDKKIIEGELLKEDDKNNSSN
jgi:hypothetical protein